MAVFIALFHKQIFSFFLPPCIAIIANNSKACFHEVRAVDPQTGKEVREAWLGVLIENRGSSAAEDVEVYFDGIDSNVIEEFGNYRTIQLARSWLRKDVVSKLPRRFSFRFDLCYMRPDSPNILNFSLITTPTAMQGVRCKESEESFFEFRITVLSSNAPVAWQNFRITTRGRYVDQFNITKIA
jgi:hypothetical protein